MKKPKRRVPIVVSLLIILAMVIPLGLETWSLFSTQRALTEVTHETLRFSVIGSFMPQDCTPAVLERALALLVNDYHLPAIYETVPDGLKSVPLTMDVLTSLNQVNGSVCHIHQSNLLAHINTILSHALEQSARYDSITRMQSLPPQLDPTRVHLTLCSDDPGYQFDSDNARCLPHDTAGEPCSTVYAQATYTYPLGSVFGLNLGETLLRSEAKGLVEWPGNSRVGGCKDALDVILGGPIPTEYSIDVTASGGSEEHVTCQQQKLITDPTRESASCSASCNPLGATFSIGDVAEAQVTVKWGNNSLTQTVQPLFWAWGPRCSERPNMKNLSRAVVFIPLPEP
jgi:hypothetical protein